MPISHSVVVFDNSWLKVRLPAVFQIIMVYLGAKLYQLPLIGNTTP
jgi:hypothetical protein